MGLLFVGWAVVVLFHLMPPDKMPPPPTAEAGMFIGALGLTGYLTMVKVSEQLGGILVASPKARTFGLLFLVPILACHTSLARGKDLLSPMLTLKKSESAANAEEFLSDFVRGVGLLRRPESLLKRGTAKASCGDFQQAPGADATSS